MVKRSENFEISLEEYENTIISSTTDLKGNITHASKAFCKLSGYDCKELIGSPHNIVRHPDMPKYIYSEMWDSLKSKQPWFGVLKNKKKNGDSYWVKTVISPKYNSLMEHIGYTALRQDITKEMEVSTLDLNGLSESVRSKNFNYIGILEISKISELGTDYPLTKIIFLKEKLEQQMSLMNNERLKIFKGVASKYIILAKVENDKELIYEFDLFLRNLITYEISLFKEKIECFLGFTKIQDFKNLDSSINAELALSIAKKNKEKIFIFDENNPEIKQIIDSLTWKEKTKFFVSEEEIWPFYQPILNIHTNEIEKYEVLARGKLNNEIISPFFFISHAENLGLIVDITKIIINKSFDYLKDKNVDFSINITEKDLKDPSFVTFITNALIDYKINPERVTLEILENITFSKDSIYLINQLQELRKIGLKLAIDDFGADNSNFARLLDINIDLLKIDAVFIKNILKNDKNIKIVKSIISMAKFLGLKTVAEFVENEDILNVVKECGIDYAQGYYIGKPEEKLLN